MKVLVGARHEGTFASMKVSIPWGKPSGIRCMPSGFTPVVV